VFRATEHADRAAYLSGVHKCLSLVVVAPLAVVMLPVYALL
jgi:hypothetical protein